MSQRIAVITDCDNCGIQLTQLMLVGMWFLDQAGNKMVESALESAIFRGWKEIDIDGDGDLRIYCPACEVVTK